MEYLKAGEISSGFVEFLCLHFFLHLDCFTQPQSFCIFLLNAALWRRKGFLKRNDTGKDRNDREEGWKFDVADRLATEVLLPETEGEKEGGREEIWRRKEAELSGPPFFLFSSFLFVSPPSVCIPLHSFTFSSLGYGEKVEGQR